MQSRQPHVIVSDQPQTWVALSLKVKISCLRSAFTMLLDGCHVEAVKRVCLSGEHRVSQHDKVRSKCHDLYSCFVTIANLNLQMAMDSMVIECAIKSVHVVFSSPTFTCLQLWRQHQVGVQLLSEKSMILEVSLNVRG